MNCAESATNLRCSTSSRGGQVTQGARRTVAALMLAGFGLVAGLCSGPAAAFDLQGHRGARGLAPENTLAGFAVALDLGVSTLELDVGMSRDGVLVVAHDPRPNPLFTRDAQGRWLEGPGPALNTLTLAELQRYDVGRIKPGTPYANTYPEQKPQDGETMPSLEAFFTWLAARGADAVRLNIEPKLSPLEPALTASPEAFAEALVLLLRRHGLTGRATVQSFDWRVMREVQRRAPEVATAALTVRQRSFDNAGDPRWTAGLVLAEHGGSVPRMVKAAGAGTWSPFHGDLTPQTVAEARQLGLKVVPWTVNDAARMAELIGWKVDGLITDHPERARRVMAERGLALPAPLPAVSRAAPAGPAAPAASAPASAPPAPAPR